MNHIEVRYSYFSQKAELRVNGEKASPYSEIAAILNRPFLEIAMHIIKDLDKEIFDDYEIDLYASEFQYEVLSSIIKESEYCRAINFHQMESLLPKGEIIERLSYLGKQNNICIDNSPEIKIYCSNDINISEYRGLQRVEVPNADIGIYSDVNNITSTVRTAVLLEDSFNIQEIEGHVCYGVPLNKLHLFWDYYELEFVIRPAIAEYLSALRYAKLDNVQKAEFEAIKNNQPTYYIGEIPASMDQGDSYTVDFYGFPPQAYSLKSENPDILSCQDTHIFAKDSGRCNLIIIDEKNKTVTSRTIDVVKHQYAEEIRLVPRFDYLRRSERNRIDIIVTPYNAEDAGKLIWNISNPSIIQVDENGNITALENGKATIIVSGKNTSARLDVEVKPSLQKISFHQQYVQIKSGEMVILDCDVSPSEASTENLTWELDNQSIASINPSKDGKRCQLIASTRYEGKGNVRCYDSESKLAAVCNIEVISKVKMSTAGKVALTCWLFGIMIPYLLPVSTIASVYGLVYDKESEHSIRYVVCAIGSIVTLLIWLMS